MFYALNFSIPLKAMNKFIAIKITTSILVKKYIYIFLSIPLVLINSLILFRFLYIIMHPAKKVPPNIIKDNKSTTVSLVSRPMK